jgi:hypothetical protein
MGDLGSTLPVPVSPTIETRLMKLKWLQAAKQERISKIVHLKQAIEDLIRGKIPEIERQILQAEQELVNLESTEKSVLESIETSVLKEN